MIRLHDNLSSGNGYKVRLLPAQLSIPCKTIETFSAKPRGETDLNALSDDLVGVVQETVQPAHVSLWLQPDPPPRRREGLEQPQS